MVGLGCATSRVPRHAPLRETPAWHEQWEQDLAVIRVGGKAVLVDLTRRRGLRALESELRGRAGLASAITLAVDHRALDRQDVRDAIRATAQRTRVWIEATRTTSSRPPLTDTDLGRLATVAELDGFVLVHAGEVTERGLLEFLSQQPSLRVLRLRSRSLTDDVIAQIGRLSELRQLDMSGTPITDTSVERLASLSKLESLDLSGTSVTDRGLRSLAPLQSLSVLKLDATDESNAATVSGEGFADLQQLPRLSEVSLARRRGLSLSALGSLRHLRVLDLSRSRGWSSAEPLGVLTELQALDLSGSGVSQLDGLDRLTRLRTLDLSDTSVEGSELVHLQGLPHLEIVYVGPRVSCDREGSIPISCDRWEFRTW